MNELLLISLVLIATAFILFLIWMLLKNKNKDKLADTVDYIIDTILRFPY